jgi:predicted permease
MRWTSTLGYWVRALFRVNRADEELQGELQFHLEKQIEANLAAGMNAGAAREAAMREFGGVEQIREECRDQRALNLFYDFGRDVRLALRQLRRSPGFAAVVVLSLALGIGANTAIFTLVHAVLLQRLPVTHPEQLYRLGDDDNCCVIGGLQGKYSIFSHPFYQELRDHTPQFSELAAFQAVTRNISVRRSDSSAVAEARFGQFVSGNYFATFGVGTLAGRAIAPADDTPRAAPVAVMSYRAWQQHYGLDPSIIGGAMTINGTPFTIIGIAPPGFFGDTLRPNPSDFWMPLATEPPLRGAGSILNDADQSWLYVIGRLRPGPDPEQVPGQVQAQVTGELQQWLAVHKEIGAYSRNEVPQQRIILSPAGRGITSLRDELARGLRMLFAVSGLMLLIACANIANLLLARGAASRTQTAIQLAIGASRGRLIRQVLTGSVLLALAGGLAGVFVAYAGTRALLLLAFRSTAYVPINAAPSPAVLTFAFLLSLLTGVVFGVVPAWINSRSDPAEALHGAGRTTRDHSSFSRKALVVLQVALSLVLLAGAGLFTESLRNLEKQRFGFETHGRLMVRVNPALAGYPVDQLYGLYQQLEQRLGRIPGVLGVSYSIYSPMQGDNWSSSVHVEGRPPDSRDSTSWDRVSAHYFEVLGVRVLRGRAIGSEDTPGSLHVAVINEAFARKFLPNTDPIGKHLGLGDASHAGDYEIVGVVEDTKYVEAREPAWPTFFLPFLQMVAYSEESDRNVQLRSNYMGDIELRFAGASGDIEREVRRTLGEMDPNLIVLRAQTFEEQLASNFTQERLIARLTALFGALALVLASIGLYGIMAHSVARRTNEIGLRMALGAARGQVLWMVLRETLLLVLAGVGLGVPAALLATRLTASFLFGLKPGDPVVLASAVIALAAVALLAGYLPAHRASRLDPMTALRYE